MKRNRILVCLFMLAILSASSLAQASIFQGWLSGVARVSDGDHARPDQSVSFRFYLDSMRPVSLLDTDGVSYARYAFYSPADDSGLEGDGTIRFTHSDLIWFNHPTWVLGHSSTVELRETDTGQTVSIISNLRRFVGARVDLIGPANAFFQNLDYRTLHGGPFDLGQSTALAGVFGTGYYLDHPAAGEIILEPVPEPEIATFMGAALLAGWLGRRRWWAKWHPRCLAA